MKKSFKIISALILSSTMAFGLGATVFASSRNVKKTEAYYSPSTHYEVSDTASELASYYSTITDSMSGSTLLSALQSLNSSKKKKDVGYSSMGTGTDGAFIYTDYDLNSTATDSNGQKYGTKVASFYTKTSTTSWNREHTWPKSHGGNLIDDDIHMTRPTITSENSDRGNSFYVEGKNSSSAGWDPYTAGYSKEMRGECARIILYGVVANSSLSLVASDSHSTSNANPDNLMGNMHTLIKWHFDYSPNVYEMNRNNGGEYLQGNRNPFIDHPEYVAKIWSSFDSTVSSLCSQNASMYSNWTPGSYSSYGTNDAAGSSTDPYITIGASSTSVKVGDTITLTANKSNITGTVQWYVSDSSSDVVSLSATSGDSITVTGVSEGTKTIYAHVGTVSAQIEITVTSASSTSGDSYSILYSDLDTSYPTSAKSYTAASGLAFTAYNTANFSSKIQFKKSGGYIYNNSSLNLSSITINDVSGTLTVYGGTSSNPSGTAITGSNGTYDLSGKTYFKIINSSSSVAKATSIDVTLAGSSSTTPTVNSVTVSPSTLSLDLNGTKTSSLTASVSVSNGAAQTVTWSSSNTSVATVSTSGSVTAVATGTATITATSTVDSTKKGTCTVTVTDSSGSSSGSGKTYQVITSTSSLSAGDKVVIVGSNNSNYYYMTNEAKTNYPWYIVGTAITPSNNQITGDNLTEWTVSKSGNYFSFTNNSVDLYGYVDGTHYSLNLGTTYTKSGSTTNVVTSFSAVKTWTYTITDSSTGAATLYANSSANVYLEYYSSSFCGYKNAPTSGSIFLFKEVTTTTNPALEFAQNFLSAFTCDATGTNAPTFASGKSWASLKTAFQALATPHQNTLTNATANESGTDIEKAVARYDYVVAKYSYENFMNRTITSSANRMNVFGGHTTNYILLILGSVSLLGGLTYLAYFLKKRKED